MTFLALLPVFGVIVAGFLLRRSGIITEWAGIDRLCYFVLFPCFFFKEISTADFSRFPVLEIGIAMALAIAIMSLALVLASPTLKTQLKIDRAQFSSVFQGVTRWHTFIAFALVPIYFGNGYIALAALAAAVMTPLLNIVCVMVILGSLDVRQVAKALATNPFLLSSLAGVLWNLTGAALPGSLLQPLDIVSRGALGLALLSVGAGLQLDTLRLNARAIGFSALFKLGAMPLLVWGLLHMLNVTGPAAAVAVLCNAVPTGSGSYVLARQLGGDAPLMAGILTFQVIAAAATIPAVMWLVSTGLLAP